MLTARNEIPDEIEQCTSKNKKKSREKHIAKSAFRRHCEPQYFAKFEHTRIYTVLR